MRHSEAKSCYGCSKHNITTDNNISYLYIKSGDRVQIKDKLYHILFIQHGKCVVKNSCMPDYDCSDNNMVLLTIRREFDIVAVDDCEIICFNFYKPYTICDNISLEETLDLMNTINYHFHALQMREPVKFYIDTIRYYLDDGINCYHMFNAKLSEAFTLFRHYYSLNEICNFFYPIIYRGDLRFVSLVEMNFINVSSVPDLADVCGYKLSKFKQLFRNYFDQPPYQWMQARKAPIIKKRLINTSIPIKVIVAEFGFSDQSHFNSYCKRYLGNTPAEIRKRTPLKRLSK